MTKDEFLTVLECLVIHLETENEKKQPKTINPDTETDFPEWEIENTPF